MGDFNFQNDARNIMKRSRQEDENSQDAHCQFKRLRIDNENNNNNNIMLSGIVSPNDTEVSSIEFNVNFTVFIYVTLSHYPFRSSGQLFF